MKTVQGTLPMNVDNFQVSEARPFASRDPLRGAPVHSKDTQSLVPGGNGKGVISGTVKSITFSNPENGFHILKIQLDETQEKVAFVGPSEPVSVGDRVEAKGTWEVHARHGRQLKTAFVRVLAPSTGREIAAFLRAGCIKGIGKKTTEKLYSFFGDNLHAVLDKPTRMMEAGITEKQAFLLRDGWAQRAENAEIIGFLGSLSLGPAMIEKIIRIYGQRAKQRLLSNPYQAARDIPGLGFKTADQMAMALGFEREDPRRLNAAVLHVFQSLARDGHCAAPRARIMKEVRKLLLVNDQPIRNAIRFLVEKKDVIEEENGGQPMLFEASILKCEKEIAERLVAMKARLDLPDDVDDRITEASLSIGIASLHEHQALAVRTALAHGLSVITGGPGAGKTASLEVMLRVFCDLAEDPVVALCAPTGRAAQRMTEATGRKATTIHRLLGWGAQGDGFQMNEENPLAVDLVVVDEASMLDIWLMRDLLRAIPPGAVLVLIGDVDQLPSVGPGRVLGDIIESGMVPVARLTRVFRQGEGSRIAQAARTINSGRMPTLSAPSRSSDLWGIFDDSPDVCLEKIVKMATATAPQLGYDPMCDVQVLVAGHGGTLGTVALNRAIQDVLNPLNPKEPNIETVDIRLRRGDRVIQTSNNYDLDVFNGDIGQVIAIAGTGATRGARPQVMVRFDDREVLYDGLSAIRELTLAYAISVHKSQGSEFPFVIFVVSNQHFIMMKKTLVYTAVTRARKLCAVVGQEKAMQVAVRQADHGRVTGLAGRLVVAGAEHERRFGEA